MKCKDTPVDPHEDARRLVEELLSAAQLFLERYGEILPMGALIGRDSELEQVPCSEGIYETHVLAQAELLRQAFARCAEQGELRACALMYEPDVTAEVKDRTAGSLAIEIEHFSGHNITMTVPYRKSAGRLEFLAPIVSEGAYRIFARRSSG